MTAARIAGRFGLDPITVIDEPDPIRYAVRVVAYRQVLADDAKQQQEGVQRR